MKPVFSVSQHHLSEKMRDGCYCVYARKHKHEPEVTGGQRSQVKKTWGYADLNTGESDKWYVTSYSVMSGSMSRLSMISCRSAFVIVLLVFQPFTVCPVVWMDGWMDGGCITELSLKKNILKLTICGVWKQYWTIWILLQRPKCMIFLEAVIISR